MLTPLGPLVHSSWVTPPISLPTEHEPLYFGGMFQLEYIQQYELRTSPSTPSEAAPASHWIGSPKNCLKIFSLNGKKYTGSILECTENAAN